MDVNIYPVFSTNYKNGRRKKFRPSSSGQEALNRWNSVQRMHRLIAANMTSEDIKCELTYKEEPATIEEAERNVYNFFRRMRRYYKKNDLREFKFFSRIEQGKKSGRFLAQLHHGQEHLRTIRADRERKTGLEPATLTLARLCSTN